MNGIYRFQTATRIAQLTDGTSNTILYSEKANGQFTGTDSRCWNWWGDGVSADTLFSTLYPMNAFRKVPKISEEYDNSWIDSASSFHPGGANFAFVDGSVRFLKDSINSWPFNPATGFPNGVNDNQSVFSLTPRTQLGVYQALSTVGGGEVISADQY
jgi:prepilin-type processing-associated H-X9-DG protein